MRTDALLDEVVRLHVVIQDWLTGAVERTPQNFGEFADAQAPSFTLVQPSGEVLARDAIVEMVEKAYGMAPGVSITIANASVVSACDDLVVVAYEEWQTTGEAETGRASTIVFEPDPSGRFAGLWRHLHETWIKPSG